MPRRIAGALALTSALCCVFAASFASAADPAPLLRVEGPARLLDPGTAYVTGTEFLPAARDAGCRRTRERHRVPGATALGLLGSAFEVQRTLRPLGVAEDEFGLRVCRMGKFTERDEPFSGWGYRVNHKFPPVGAGLFKVDSNDEVLWYFSKFGQDINTGDELDLVAPARARPGPVQVRVVAYSFDGKKSPAADGTLVRGGRTPVPTVNGRATVVVEPGREALRAVHRPDIASARTPICVSARLSECPRVRGRRIVGTAGRDAIADTDGADVIRARAGADRINVRGGEADRVDCGLGRDRLVLSGNDTARGCEVLIRR
jgi:hypothetical protein